MKDTEAIERIKYLCPTDGYYVAYSGGKDSTVILDLIRRSGVPYDAHYNLTTVDPPELVQFVRQQEDVTIEHPKTSMWPEIIANGMPPTRLARFCCRLLKEHGGYGRTVVTGVRWAESPRRAKRRMVETCFQDGTKHYLHPIIDWSHEDVWAYIHDRGLPYCSLYDEGLKRLGCILCPMGSKRQRMAQARRWPQYRQAYLNTFSKMLLERERKGLKTQWRDADDVYRWWLDLRESDEYQLGMFE